MDANSEAKLSLLHPVLAKKIRTMAEMLAQEGITIIVTQGFRSWMQQQELYNQGRKTPGKIVTNAQGGHSWHNYGLACDCAPKNADGSIDWNAENPQWKRMETVGQSLGLTSGIEFRTFPDAPHFQLTGKFGLSPDDEVRSLYLNGGTLAVYEEAGLTEKLT